MSTALPPLLPPPHRFDSKGQPGFLPNALPTYLDAPLPESLATGWEIFAKEAGNLLGQPLPAPVVTEGAAEGLTLRFDPAGLPPEGYRLELAPPKVTLQAADPAGAFYGLQTLLGLLRAGKGKVPTGLIEDAPALSVRGYMLDISRDRVPTMASLRLLVDRLAMLRFNQFQLYTEHTFAFAGHESVWGMASPMTAEEIRELDAYCAARFIELVPNQNSFGHFERWLRHPRYRHLAICPDGFQLPWGAISKSGTTLYPDGTSRELLQSLYDELLPSFSSRQINIGGDEPWELGQGRSEALCRAEGKHNVYREFLVSLMDLLHQKDRQTQFWAEIILEDPANAKLLPPNAIALAWGYGPDHPFTEQSQIFAEAGVPFMLCPGTSCWNSLTCRLDHARLNMSNAASSAKAAGALGILLTDWGDGGHHQPMALSLLPLAWQAAESWGTPQSREESVRAAGLHLFGEEDAATARLLDELGHVHTELPLGGNGSQLNTLLLDSSENFPAFAQGMPKKGLERSLERLEAVLQELGKIAPQTPDANHLRDDIEISSRMGLFAAKRGLAVLASGQPGSLALRGELAELIGRYEVSWLSRSRPGGLHESSGRLRAVFQQMV